MFTVKQIQLTKETLAKAAAARIEQVNADNRAEEAQRQMIIIERIELGAKRKHVIRRDSNRLTSFGDALFAAIK